MRESWAADEDDWDDDFEDGEFDSDEFDDEAVGPCPECGAELHVDAEVCNACGYWLTTADRHKLWDEGSSVRGAMGVGKIVLVLILVVLLSGIVFF